MWIRSQDKTRLVKLNYIKINGNDIEAVHSDMFSTLIGIYSTQEKALKVLDMIQEKICGINKIFQSNELYDHTQRIDEEIKEIVCLPDIRSDISYISTPLFFQMPNDDEV